MIFSRTKQQEQHGAPPKWLFVMRLILFVGALSALFSLGIYVFGLNSKQSVFSQVSSLLESSIVDLEIIGRDNKNRFYILTAASAQAGAQSGFRGLFAQEGKLSNVEIDLEWQKDNWLSLRSASGRFNSKDGRISVGPNFNVYFSNGYQMKAVEGSIELKKGDMVIQGQVQGWGPLGEITAAALDVEKSGEYMRFYGGVEAVLLPQTESEKTKREGKQ